MNPLSAVTAGLGAVQSIVGFVQKGKANREIKNLIDQRKPFETEEGTYDLRNSAAARTANGLGATTLDYLLGQTDRAFSSSVSASQLLGGNPNDLSGAFQKKIDSIMKIGMEDAQAGLKAYTIYAQAQDALNKSKEAEQISKDNLLKDQIQAAAARGADATKNIQGGLNTVLGAASASQQMNLYKDKTEALKPVGYGGQKINLRLPMGGIDEQFTG